MTTTMKWVLVGASDIAATRVIPAIRASGDEIVAVISRSRDRAADFAKANGIELGTDDIAATAGVGAQAAYISSLNELHYEHAKTALQAGLHVLCEKPLTLDLDEAEELDTLAADRGLVLAVNHHLPGSALHSRVRELVESGAIGDVLSARIAHAVSLPERLRGWRVDAGSPGAGVILDITCHDASVLNPLLGEPVEVTAIAVAQAPWNDGDVPDAAMVTIRYVGRSGRAVIAQTHDAFTVTSDPTLLVVHGSTGTITVRDAMTQDPDGSIELVNESGRLVIEAAHRDLYAIVLDAFTAAIGGNGRPTATVRDGINAVRVALAAQQAAESGHTITLTTPAQLARTN